MEQWHHQPHIVEFDTSDDCIFLKSFVRRVHCKMHDFSCNIPKIHIFLLEVRGVF